MKDGFTFIEVLIALAVAALLVTVTCSSLITALRMERSAGNLRDGSLLVETITSSSYRQALDETYIGTAFSDWDVRSESVALGKEPDREIWRVWMLSPKERPSLRIELAYRSE